MSSTRTTSLSYTSASRSFTIRTRPVSGAYAEMARKSTSTGMRGSTARTRSARNSTLPLSTATSSTLSLSLYASLSSRPTRSTPSCNVARSKTVLGALMPVFRHQRAQKPSRTPGVFAQRGAQHGGAQALAELAQLGQRVHRLPARARVTLLEQRHHELFEERRLALGRRLVHAEVAGLDAVAHEAGREV